MTPVRACADEGERENASPCVMCHGRPDPARRALEHALEHALERHARDEEEIAMLRAALGQAASGVPLKQAAHDMGIEESAARKRAQRGAGTMRDGRWFFSQAYVDEVRAARMSR